MGLSEAIRPVRLPDATNEVKITVAKKSLRRELDLL